MELSWLYVCWSNWEKWIFPLPYAYNFPQIICSAFLPLQQLSMDEGAVFIWGSRKSQIESIEIAFTVRPVFLQRLDDCHPCVLRPEGCLMGMHSHSRGLLGPTPTLGSPVSLLCPGSLLTEPYPPLPPSCFFSTGERVLAIPLGYGSSRLKFWFYLLSNYLPWLTKWIKIGTHLRSLHLWWPCHLD